MGRASDWSPVDMDEDPTPGDPERISELADRLLDFADDVAEALRNSRDMSGDSALAEFVGETADAFAERFEDVPTNLTKLQESYELAGLALQRYWPLLESAQWDADRALDDAEAAREELATAQDWLSAAAGALETAQDDQEEEPEGPDEEQLRAEVRRAVEDATTDRDNAQSAVDSAQSRLDAAIRLAEQARAAREEAADRCVSDLEEASDAGMQNKSWWEKVTDWVSENWDTIMEVVQVIATVLAVVALFVGGPLVWGLVLAVSLIVLADTLVKYANGEASLWDVGFAVLDCIPGGRFVGRGAALARTGMRRTSSELAGQTSNFRRQSRAMDGRYECGDPVDVATGELVMSATDLELPGILPLTIERHHISTYRDGRWFGPSYASTLDQRLVLDRDEVRLLSADGMVLHYPVPLPDPDMPVLPVEGPRWPLAWDGKPGGAMTVRQPLTGHTLHFAPVPGARHNELPLTAITDRRTNRIDIRYDADGAPAEMSHSGGYRVGIATYDERVTSLTLLSDPGRPILIAYDYDRAGNLAKIFNSSGLPLLLTHDEHDRLVRWEDRNNTWYRYEYDAAGRMVFSTGTDRALEYTYTYDPDHHRTTATNSLGQTSVFQFDEGYQLVSETDPLGNTTHHEWDRFDRALAVTDPLGRTTRYEYDEDGNVTAVVRPDGTRIRAEYNELHLTTLLVEPDGTEWSYAYDAAGNRTTVLDPAGHRTRYTHHPTGAVATVTDALGNTTTIRCDAAGLPTAVADAAGEVTAIDRDAFGRVVRVLDPVGAATSQAWSVEGKLLRRVSPVGAEHVWEWDGEGNLLAHTDPNGGVTRYTYGPFDLPASITQPDGTRYAFTRDTELNLTQVSGHDGQVWTYTYDAAGYLTAETDFDGRTTLHAVDAAGQVTSTTNPAGQTVTYAYDPLGRLTRKVTSDGAVTTYNYDRAGRVTYAASPGVELERAYDPLGNLLTETVNGRTLRLAYDPVGRLMSRTTPAGHTSTWTYTAGGHLHTLSTGDNALSFDHDPTGSEISRTLASTGLTLTQAWDPAGRLTSQSLVSGAKDRRVLHQRHYTYRADNYLASLADPAGTTQFTLDVVGRVTAVAESGGHREAYTYDPSGNQTSAHFSGLDTSAQGERAYSGTLLTRAGHTSYNHDAAGRVTERRKVRLSKNPDRWRYAWDAENRLVGCTTPDGSQWRYLYDAFDRRVAKQRLSPDGRSVAEQTDFTWHHTNLAEQTTAGGTTLTWDHHGLIPLTQTETGHADIDRRFYAIITDLVGTPTHLVDEDGRIAWRSRSTVWGVADAGTGGAAGTPLRFPGQYADDETGWHYNFRRHYDPAIARYTTADPLGLDPSPNPRAYVHNPHLWVDPLGLAAHPPMTQNQARRESMRQAGIPTSQQPRQQIRTDSGYQYVYDVPGPGGSRRTALVTDNTMDDVADHGPHWEAGLAKDPLRMDNHGRYRVQNDKSKVEYE